MAVINYTVTVDSSNNVTITPTDATVALRKGDFLAFAGAGLNIQVQVTGVDLICAATGKIVFGPATSDGAGNVLITMMNKGGGPGGNGFP